MSAHDPRNCRLCSALRHPSQTNARRALAGIGLPRQTKGGA